MFQTFSRNDPPGQAPPTRGRSVFKKKKVYRILQMRKVPVVPTPSSKWRAQIAANGVLAAGTTKQIAIPRCAQRLAKLAKFCKILAGSLSKPKFARKYAFYSIFKLYKRCILLHRCNLKILAKNRFENSAIFVKIRQNFWKYRKIKLFAKICQISRISA